MDAARNPRMKNWRAENQAGYSNATALMLDQSLNKIYHVI